jgi:hypothetical protein
MVMRWNRHAARRCGRALPNLVCARRIKARLLRARTFMGNTSYNARQETLIACAITVALGEAPRGGRDRPGRCRIGPRSGIGVSCRNGGAKRYGQTNQQQSERSGSRHGAVFERFYPGHGTNLPLLSRAERCPGWSMPYVVEKNGSLSAELRLGRNTTLVRHWRGKIRCCANATVALKDKKTREKRSSIEQSPRVNP